MPKFNLNREIFFGVILLFSSYYLLNYLDKSKTPIMVSKHSHATDVNERIVLPKNVRPVHYDLEIKPDMEKFVFDGKVSIK
jgi:hypothetical protein